MQPIPGDILKQFNAVLTEKAVPSSLHDDYRKWLKYYLDFRMKYPPPDIKSEQVRLFIEKMRSKGRAGKDLHNAAHALSLFFSLKAKKQAVSHGEQVRAALSAGTVFGSEIDDSLEKKYRSASKDFIWQPRDFASLASAKAGCAVFRGRSLMIFGAAGSC